MTFTNQETDYLMNLLTNQLMALLSRVTRWQTHSLSQHQYNQQVHETLQPELNMLTQITAKLQGQARDQTQLGAHSNWFEETSSCHHLSANCRPTCTR
ncbi:hypothetical protein [Lactiplantibacillus plantarum]|uniref:hypothetical protein n=1 Tax=Lactiplantibacillus plantarum TaxID=1590 RepID=UPI001E3F821A|nr:hypothetical protein [Lactiplantibacillus plantarum]